MQSSKILLSCLSVMSFLFSCSSFSDQSPIDDAGNSGTGKNEHIPMDSTAAVSWLAHSDNTQFLKGKNNEFYLYIKLRGNDIAQNKKRVPLNISLVLDRSGSMQGDKINYAKKAAAFVIDQMNSDDIVSIVDYDDQVDVISPSQPVKNKEVLKKKIDALFDRGSTNLTGGTLEGYSQAESTKKDGFVNRVLLLTDGLANVGITEPSQIKKLVEKKYTEKGIALSTFGLGADYNEDLLTQLAETGRANYYFIDSPDKIPAIFAKELKGLLSVVAQNAVVQIQLPLQLELVKVYGYPSETSGNTVTVRFNDMYAADEKGILIKLRSKNAVQEKLTINCQMNYTSASDFEKIVAEKKLIINPATDTVSIAKTKNKLVEEMIGLFESTEKFDDILTDVDNGDYDRAKVKVDSAIQELQLKQKSIPSAKLKKQEEKLRDYSNEMEHVKTMRETDKKMYQKSNKSENYRTKKGKEQ